MCLALRQSGMSPRVPPVDPSNGCLSLSPLLGDVRAQSGRRRLMPKLFAKTCRIIEFQVGLCLYVTAAVKAASHFGRAQGDHSGQSTFEVRWNLSRAWVFKLGRFS